MNNKMGESSNILLVKEAENNNSFLSEDFDSGTLMRDASQEETVLIKAVKISKDQFNENGEKGAGSPTYSKNTAPLEETNLTNTQKDSCKQIIQSSAHNLTQKNTDLSIKKTERKLPKTPLKVNSFLQKDTSSVVFSFKSYSNDSSKNKEEKEFPLTPMGVLAHRLRTLDRSLVPPSA